MIPMEIQKAQNYITDYSGINLDFKPWTDNGSFPLYLSSDFDFFSAQTDIGTVLAAQPKGVLTFTRLHTANIRLKSYEQWQFNVIFILPKASHYITKRLIDQKIAFVIPGKQIYAPFLGTVYVQRTISNYLTMNNSKLIASGELTPSTLSVYLFHIKNGFEHKQTEISNNLGISRMTLHRAYIELMREKLIVKNGDRMEYSLPKDWKSEFRINCRKFKNPVRKQVYLDGTQSSILKNGMFYRTSETALAEISDMSEPMNEFYAIYSQDWNLIKDKVLTTETLENDSIILEIWSIPVPHEDEIVLPLALYLSLTDEKDERIKMAIESMLEKELAHYD